MIGVFKFDPWVVLKKESETHAPAKTANPPNRIEQARNGLGGLAGLAEVGVRDSFFESPSDPWLTGLERLAGIVPPDGYPAARWQQIAPDGFALLDRWGDQFRALGWGVLDLFGICLAAPWPAVHLMGLALLLGGDRVEAITATTARIVTRGGLGQSFTRKHMLGAVPVWGLR